MIFVTQEIATVLEGKGSVAGFPEAEASAVNDRFMVGHVISLSLERSKTAVLKKVDGVHAVWSLAYRRPKPGWRLLGRFLEKDVFVGLRLSSRTTLGRDLTAFTESARDVVADWQILLPGLDPEDSADADQILSPLYWDLDNDL